MCGHCSWMGGFNTLGGPNVWLSGIESSLDNLELLHVNLNLKFEITNCVVQTIANWMRRFPIQSNSQIEDGITRATYFMLTMVDSTWYACIFIKEQWPRLRWKTWRLHIVMSEILVWHNISWLMSYVHAPSSRFKNKTFGCRNPSASYWIWSKGSWTQLIGWVMCDVLWIISWQNDVMHINSNFFACCQSFQNWTLTVG